MRLTHRRNMGRAAPRTLGAHELRKQWDEALTCSRQAAAQAVAAGDEQGEDLAGPVAHAPLTRLMAALRDLNEANFPVDSWASRQMAAGFLIVARAFVNPAMDPTARTACAPALDGCRRVLADAMGELQHREAGAWQRQMGERD